MSKPFNNINVATDTGVTWVTYTNNLLTFANNEIVSVNATGGVTTGNGAIVGTFGADTLFGGTLRGGSLTTPNTLFITSNLVVNSTIFTVGNSTINTVINSTSVSTGNITASKVATFGANVTVNGAVVVSGNLTVNGTLSFTSSSPTNLVPTNNTFSLGNVTNRWNLFAVNGSFTGVLNAVSVGLSGDITSTANITCNSVNITNSVTLGLSGELAFQVISLPTAGLTAQVIDSFAGASFRTAKYVIQITAVGSNNYYASEILILYDGTNALTAEYGAITTNTSVGTITSNVSAGTVQLVYTPTKANTVVRLYRTLFDV